MSKLTNEQMAKIEPKISKFKCPVCGSGELSFNPEITQVVGFPTDGKSVDFSKASWINCVCGECLSCGYIVQFRLGTLLK